MKKKSMRINQYNIMRMGRIILSFQEHFNENQSLFLVFVNAQLDSSPETWLHIGLML